MNFGLVLMMCLGADEFWLGSNEVLGAGCYGW